MVSANALSTEMLCLYICYLKFSAYQMCTRGFRRQFFIYKVL